jgi:hypothetical protein
VCAADCPRHTPLLVFRFSSVDKSDLSADVIRKPVLRSRLDGPLAWKTGAGERVKFAQFIRRRSKRFKSLRQKRRLLGEHIFYGASC